MCTVSWLHTADGYHLFSNRDEKHARAIAEPPRAWLRDGVHFLAPRDPEQGGSWIAVNEAGVALCLLNGHRDAADTRAATSRGKLLTGLASCRSQEQAIGAARSCALSRFAPFSLAVLAPGHPAALLEWDSRTLTVVEDAGRLQPLSSSSFDTAGARSARVRSFARADRHSAAGLTAYHRSHSPWPGPYSVCMHRGDAATVSFTEVRVSGNSVSMIYTPGAPCRHLQSVTVDLHDSLDLDCVLDTRE